MSQFVSTTALTGLRAVGSHADRSLVRVQSVLDREFAGRLNFILADPVPRKDGTGIDWYVDSDDSVSRLVSLEPELLALHLQRLRTDLDQVHAVARSFEERSDPVGLATASALRSAATYPGDEFIWVAGESKSQAAILVITAWGYEPSVKQSGISQIAAKVQVPGVRAQEGIPVAIGADEPPPHRPEGRTRMFRRGNWSFSRLLLPFSLWLLTVSLAMATGLWLLPACGIRLPGGIEVYGFGNGAYCPQTANPVMEGARESARSLSSQMLGVEAELKERIAQCVPPAPAIPETMESKEARNTASEALERTGIEQNDDETSLTLIWHTKNDLDIVAVCPDGAEVAIRKRACNGSVDFDDNGSGSGPAPLVDNPVEHLVWKTSEMPPGRYKVLVRHYRNPSKTVPSEFTAILQRGSEFKKVEGLSTYQDLKPIEVLEFDVP